MQDKAEDVGGLSPAGEDNAVLQFLNRRSFLSILEGLF